MPRGASRRNRAQQRASAGGPADRYGERIESVGAVAIAACYALECSSKMPPRTPAFDGLIDPGRQWRFAAMNDHPVPLEPISPGARVTKTSDILLWLAVLALALAAAFGIFYLCVETVKPTAMADWAIVKGIWAIPSWFPTGAAPTNPWDLGQSLPFAFSWSINKMALGVSLLLFLVLIAASIVPFLGLAGLLAYLPWRFYFKARIGAGSMPAPISGRERGE
ncbi:hypothetical protein [Bosea vaviloviae]|jgi:hypothetical protein|nr:hypothetical protein [Bosea vaviloviae]